MANIPKPEDVKLSAGGVNCELKWDAEFPAIYERKFDQAQAFVDMECIRLMHPLTPFRSGHLREAAVMSTTIGSGTVEQKTPYARRQYYEHKSQSRWFSKMANRHKNEILQGARAYFQ